MSLGALLFIVLCITIRTVALDCSFIPPVVGKRNFSHG